MKEKDDSNATFEYVGFGFTLKEATKLMHHEVVRSKDRKKPHTLERIGIVSGILHLNEEIELVVQFYKGIEQFNKDEFNNALTVISNE